MVSHSLVRHQVYEIIEDLTRPGDVCFFITEDLNCFNKLSNFQKWNRTWLGFAANDISIWHVGILSKFEKKPKSSQIRPYFIHSTRECGVTEQHVSPEYFTSKNIENGKEVCRTIMEVLRDEDLAEDQNRALVDFCRSQLGKPFPKSILGESLTYLLGLPNFINHLDEFSCHSLVFVAFDHIGVAFPHHLEYCPWFNLARAIGHPLGHSKECVNQRFAYLRDQHLYRDPRFKCVVSLTYNQQDEQILVNENPSKYSWNVSLANKYRN